MNWRSPGDNECRMRPNEKEISQRRVRRQVAPELFRSGAVGFIARLGLVAAAVGADEDHYHLARLRTFIAPGMARSVLHHCITST
jgi:hypothetical protein